MSTKDIKMVQISKDYYEELRKRSCMWLAITQFQKTDDERILNLYHQLLEEVDTDFVKS